jgi:hypothetical protein
VGAASWPRIRPKADPAPPDRGSRRRAALRNQEVIATAAGEFDSLRTAWLNPPEWTRDALLEFPGSADGPWARYVRNVDSSGVGTVRCPRPVSRDAEAVAKLVKRTLTTPFLQCRGTLPGGLP